MDLLFKRYASPFLFLDNLIESDDLSEGIDTIIRQANDDKDWELYLSLNPWNETTFDEWKKEMYKTNESLEINMTKDQAENYFKAELEKSQNILNNFKPPKR